MEKKWSRANFGVAGEENNLPFNPSLKRGYMAGRKHLAEFQSGQDKKVIRGILRVDNEGKNFGAIELEDLAKTAQHEFRLLSEKYGINVAKTEFVVGEDADGNKCVFSVTDRIEGQNFDQIAEEGLSDNSREEWKNLISKANETAIALFDYYCDKAANGGSYLADAAYFVQYVYGRKSQSGNNDLYLVDTDILLGNIDNETKSKELLSEKILTVWLKFIKSTENKLSDALRKQVYLNEARDYISRRVAQPAPDGFEKVFEELNDLELNKVIIT